MHWPPPAVPRSLSLHYIHLFLSSSLSPRIACSRATTLPATRPATDLDHPVSLCCICGPLRLSSPLRIECRAVIALVHLSTTNFYSLSFLPCFVPSFSRRTDGRTRRPQRHISFKVTRPPNPRPPAKKTLRSIIVNFPPF